MRFHALALAGCASVFLSSSARAEDYLPPPKLVLDDGIGFGTTGSTGWFGYQRFGSSTGDRGRSGRLRAGSRGDAGVIR